MARATRGFDGLPFDPRFNVRPVLLIQPQIAMEVKIAHPWGAAVRHWWNNGSQLYEGPFGTGDSTRHEDGWGRDWKQTPVIISCIAA